MESIRLFAWNNTLGRFQRLTVDPATGNLNVTGGGGGGGSGPVTVADGADVAQGATGDPSSANTIVGLLKAIKAAVQGTLTVATHAVTQSGVWTTARSWTLSSATDSVNVGNFPATQPVSLATNTPDVTDRSARLLGHVTVDNASIAVTGFPATQPVTEAALEAAIGAASDSPNPYTVLDQLTQLRKLTTRQLAAIQALAPAAPKPKTYTTLMHRS